MHPLRSWRSENRITLEDLAKQTDLSIYTLHRIETGKVRNLDVRDALVLERATKGKVTSRKLAAAM